VRIGAVFPQTEIGTDPADVARWATQVEQLGYQHILVYDHVLGAGTSTREGWRGYSSDDSFHEVFVLLGYVAALTTSVELVTGVLILPQRQTVLVAKQAAEVDVLSRGRMRLGIGVGWNPVEYEGLGESFANRGARSEEQIELMRALWTAPTITYHGRWHHVDNAGIRPLPVRQNIPIWIGGVAETVLRRIGRIGDGWLPQRPPDDEAAALLDRIRGYAGEAGRSPTEIGIEARLTIAREPRDSWLAFVTGWQTLGATHLGINTMGMGFRSVDEHLGALAGLIDRVRTIV
jgi:probable F420-dependent oxidoreductase